MKSYRLLLILCVGTWIGCSSGTPEKSITEKKRDIADPRVGRYLIESDQAYKQGFYNMALAYTDSAEALTPDLADLHYLRGLIYTKLNQIDIAQTAFDVALEYDPEYKGAHFNRGLNAFKQGQIRDAIADYKKENEFSETTQTWLELGRAYAKLGEPDSAEIAYKTAIAVDSTNSTAIMWLGQLYEEMGEFDKALALSLKGLSEKPENLDYKYIIGSLLYRTEKFEEAESYLRPVAEERPWHHGAQYNLGQVYMRLGQEEKSKFYLTRADSAQQVQQRIIEVQEDINRAPDSLQFWIEFAQLLRGTGQIERAVDVMKVAVTMQPWNMNLQNNLALLSMENGNYVEAVNRYHSILSLDSTLVEVWVNLGAAYANARDAEAARWALNKALEQNPRHERARSYLARLPKDS